MYLNCDGLHAAERVNQLLSLTFTIFLKLKNAEKVTPDNFVQLRKHMYLTLDALREHRKLNGGDELYDLTLHAINQMRRNKKIAIAARGYCIFRQVEMNYYGGILVDDRGGLRWV